MGRFNLSFPIEIGVLLLVGVAHYGLEPGFSIYSLAFTPYRVPCKNGGCAASRQYVTLSAKPPPTSNFDLSAIEAFEATIQIEDQGSVSDSDTADHESSNGTRDKSDSKHIISVPSELEGKRIDAVLSHLMEPKLSRSACGNLVTDGCVHQIVEKNGSRSYILLNRKSFKVDTGMTLEVLMPNSERPDEIVAQNIDLKILYEDEHMIVINKAAGMVVHPASGNWDGTVVNALAYYLEHESPYGAGDFVGADALINMGGNSSDDIDEITSLRPGIVHRLDKGTTGVLIVSKTKEALSKLSESFASRKVKKTYLAITVGNPGKRVAINKPIGRHPIHRQRMRVVPDPHQKNSSGISPKQRARYKASLSSSSSKSGRHALSFVDTLKFDGKLSIVQVRIETGRTHQIRVHLQDRHTPIYGDDVYGISDWNKRLLKGHGIQRPLLHAHRLEIEHPISGELMTFVAPMAEDMVSIAKTIWPEGVTLLSDAFREE